MCVLASQPLRQSSYQACMCARRSCGDCPSARVPTSCADDGAGSGDGAADWAFAPLPVKSTASTNQHASVEIVAMENPGSTLNAAACAATPLGPIRANTDHHLDHCRTLIPPPEVGRRPTARNSKSGARQPLFGQAHMTVEGCVRLVWELYNSGVLRLRASAARSVGFGYREARDLERFSMFLQ